MRWIWFDRFIEFEAGRRARSIKCVSLAEEQISDHFPGSPLLPNSLVIEGLAQTGGLLVGQTSDFKNRVVLAKISKIRFHAPAFAGDTLTYTAVIDNLGEEGASVTATSHIGDRLQAEGHIFFAHLSGRSVDRDLFDPVKFINTMRIVGLFDVGKNPDGTPIHVPAHLAKAEAEYLGDALT